MTSGQDQNAQVGTPAPDFTLPDNAGNPWRLRDQLGKVVVMFFYPGDETPVCTRQMCLMRDRWADYAATGAEIVGISTDSVESHRGFIEHYHLPIRLLADTSRTVGNAYGARSWIPGRLARSVFIIDAKGIIRHRDVRPIGLLRPKDNDIIKAIREAQSASSEQ